MSRVNDFLSSGLIQLYVLGIATPEEEKEVEQMASTYEEVREALDAFSDEIERFSLENAIEPPETLKALIFDSINQIEASAANGASINVPILHVGSRIDEYRYWINQAGMSLPEHANNIHATIIAHDKQMTTAIVWVKNELPEEIHEKELERFLVIEGSCRIFIEDKDYHLSAGDFFSVPLNRKHHGIVTSMIPCKVLLQRIAI